jgi:DNA primase
MCSAGVDNVVAVCGSKISEDQFKLIRFADRIIAAFDNPKVDSAGKLASDEIRKLANKYGANLVFFNYGETGKKDPGDLTNDEIVWGLSHAQSALFGEKAYV